MHRTGAPSYHIIQIFVYTLNNVRIYIYDILFDTINSMENKKALSEEIYQHLLD